MSRKFKFTILILTYNSQKHIVKLVRSLFKYLKGVSYEILIIDNGSTDKTISLLNKKEFSEIRIIQRKMNYGFGQSINWGVKFAKGEYLLILNPDTEVIDSSLKTLLNSALINKNNILGPINLKKNGQVHGTFVRRPNAMMIAFDFTNLRKLFPDNRWHKSFYYRDTDLDDIAEVDAISGSSMIVNRKRFISLDGFDNSFFMYLEDIDFCLRAKKAGLHVLLCKNARIYHEAGGSSKNNEKINLNAWIDSRYYFVDKYFSGLVKIFLKTLLVIDALFIKIISRIKNENLLSKRRIS